MTKQEYNRLDRIVRGLEEFKDRPESVNLRIVELRAMLNEAFKNLMNAGEIETRPMTRENRPKIEMERQ
jgi:hypothetical protein